MEKELTNWGQLKNWVDEKAEEYKDDEEKAWVVFLTWCEMKHIENKCLQ